jgi:hypothetical protein
MDTNPEPIFAIPPAGEFYSSEPTVTMPWQRSLFFWILFSLFGAAFTVTAFIYGVHVGKSQISSVTRSVPSPDSQGSAPIPAPTTAPAPPFASGAPASPSDTLAIPNGAPVEAPKTNDASGSTVKRLGAEGNSTALRDQHAKQALEAGQSELAAALAYLRGTNGVRDSSRAALLLWAAVSKGNSTAEVILADLYLRGDGVTKSCEQGRVLLTTASKSGNVEGGEKLQQLNTKGCQ